MAERIIGIDFGTSTSAIRVRRYEDGKPLDDAPKAVTFDNGKPTVPTLITEGLGSEPYFGYDAEQKSRRRGALVRKNFKLDLESPDETVRAEARRLTALFLKHLGETYQHQRGFLGADSDEEKTVVSYPVKWSGETRAFMVQAARDAGFPAVEGLDEAQACIRAITEESAEGLKKVDVLHSGKPCTILLIDMGAGTTDLVLCRYTSSSPEILATWPETGELLFGGAEIDELLYRYIKGFYPDNPRVDILCKSNGNEFKAWKEHEVSPALLRKLSVDSFDALEFVLGDEAEFDPLDRAAFEALAGDYLKGFPRLVNGALQHASLSGADVDLVILTGGHSQWYFAREMLLGRMLRFGELRLDKIQAQPERIVSLALPQETVARGLVVYYQDSEALYQLGERCYYGRDVEQDYTKAVSWYAKAAEQGHPGAQYSLGFCYYNGQGVTKDYAKAVYWYTKAAEQGYASAQSNLGYCYENGHGVTKDYAKAVHWYTKAAEQGNMYAQNNLGVCYENGQGVTKDYAKAVYWYTKAAEQGYASAQNNLGYCYENGQGVTKDYAKAVFWYTKAAEQGYASAQCNLGYCYKNGHDVTKDYAKAVFWYTKAAEQGYARAQNNLGACYHNGQGVTKDYAKAVFWYTKAAEQGYATAQYNLGVCYDNGQGVTKDYAKAVHWYTKAAEQGYASAQRELGKCFYFGTGAEKDYHRAQALFREASDNGDAEGAFRLAGCYANGYGVPISADQAKHYYQMAVERGYRGQEEPIGWGHVVLKRRQRFLGSIRTSVLLVDGKKYTVENGQSKEIKVKPGPHTFNQGTENLLDYGNDINRADDITLNLSNGDIVVFDLTIREENIYFNGVKIT